MTAVILGVIFIVISSVALLPRLEAIGVPASIKEGKKSFTVSDLAIDLQGVKIGGIILGALFIVISSVALLPRLEAICYNVGGNLVTVFTPVDDNGYLKLDVIPQYAQFLKDGGVDGVIVAATTGEGPSLNETDNKKLLDAWMAVAPSLNLFVISSVGSVPLPFTLEMSRYSEKIGVDAIFALPEIYYRPKCAEELVDNLLLIADAAPNTPLVYDDIPAFTRVEVDIVELFELATEKIPTFRGVKSDEFENLLLLRNKPKGDQKIYAGNYFYLAPIVFLQYKNIVLKEFNVFPELIIDIIKSGERRKLNRTTKLYEELVDLIEVITENGSRIAVQKALKAAMPIITGIDVGPVLRPIVPYSKEENAELERRLRDANVTIVKSYNYYD